MTETIVTPSGASKTDALKASATNARRWLLEDAAPLWSTRGRTASGLFAERMTLAGEPDASYFRSFVQARHIFSFVEIGRMGWDGPWQALVSETIDTVLNTARRSDGLFAHRLDQNAGILDNRADLYDQAFLLLAMASAGQALDRPALFDAAESHLDCLDALWSHRLGGYREGEIVDASIRRQNPHMHLFESFLALYEASGRQRFLDKAEEIATLCSRHFIDPATGALLEYFGEDWTPIAGVTGQIVEPGHCFEWAWLFERLAARGWAEGTRVSDGLCAFGRDHGIDAGRGVAINEVLTNGAVHNGNARLWPQTERIKAALARHRRLGSNTEANEAVNAAVGLQHYLQVAIPGLWRDKLTEDGGWIEELAPGSSLYHISCAYAELVALAD
jgi:mannose/cellobiose epimerase-like protein (N-acyl-D-glucosamine 2-epimerase family)